MNLPVLAAPSSAMSSTSQIQPPPHPLVLRANSPTPPVNSSPTQYPSRPFNSEVDGGETYGSFIEQIRWHVANVRSCAEHQKRITGDVLQLSRLRSHRLEILKSYYRPWEMVQTTLRAFSLQADSKVESLLLWLPLSPLFFPLTSFVSGIGVESGVKRFGRAVGDIWRQPQDISNSIQPSLQCNQVHSPREHHSHC